MTPAERFAYMVRAADLQLEATLNAIASLREMGLLSEDQVTSDLKHAHDTHDWNIGQAQMDFDLDMGVTVEPPSTRLRKVKLSGFEGDNGSASHA